MTEMLDRITPEMSEEEVLGVLLDEIMARAEPDVAEAIRFCAIPHWFNEEIIAWLRGEGLKSSHRSREILAALTELTFVGPYYERGWAYHENVRDLLLRRWREKDGKAFKELSGAAAAYYADKSRAGESPEEERAEWRREEMYHLLLTDEDQGVELFRSMFDKAIWFYQLSTCNLLLGLAGERESNLGPDGRLWLRLSRGELWYVSARWDEALRIFEGLEREELSETLEGTLADDLGGLYYNKGEWDKAIEYYQRSLAIWEKLGHEHKMGLTFNDLGIVYKAKGEWDRAIEYYERSLAIKEKLGDEHGMATSLNNLGSVYQDKGKWERAIEYYERSLAIKEKVGDEHGMSTTFNNLGSVYKARGEWERAIEYYERSLAITEKVGDEHRMATVFNNLGSVYQDKGEWDRAIGYYERSLAIKEKVGDIVGQVTTLSNLLVVALVRFRFRKAPEYEKRLGMSSRRLGNVIGEGCSYEHFWAYLYNRRYLKAARCMVVLGLRESVVVAKRWISTLKMFLALRA